MPSATAEQAGQLKIVVDRVLDAWVGYQLALKNQSAGSATNSLNAQLREELTAVLAKRADIDKYDIEDWLEDAFNEAFNLLLEDGSVPEMSQLLFECTDSIYKGDLPRAEAALARLPSSAQTQHLAQQTAVQEAAEESGSEPEDE